MNNIFTSIKRTPHQSMAGFLVLFLTLFLSTALFMVLSFFYSLLGYVERQPQVTVYFKNEVSEKDIFKVRDQLIQSGKTLSIKYISKEKALEIYKKLNKDNPLLLEMVSADILPSSLEIYAKKPAYLSQIAEFLKKQPATDEVQFQKNIVDRLVTLTNILRKGSIIIFGYLLLMAVVVLVTTTLFKIALKKDEIELLQLLGANKSYIIRPFLFEGVFFGIVASLLSFFIILGTVLYFRPFLNSYLQGIRNLDLQVYSFSLPIWPLNPLFVILSFIQSFLFGISIPIISVFFATKKYLK